MPAEKPAFGKKGTPLIYAGTKLTDVLTTEKSLVSTTRVSIGSIRTRRPLAVRGWMRLR